MCPVVGRIRAFIHVWGGGVFERLFLHKIVCTMYTFLLDTRYKPMKRLRAPFALFCAVLLMACLPNHVYSQAAGPSPDTQITGQGSLSFALGLPTGEFNQNIDNLGYGANVYIGAEFPNSIFGIGLDFSFFVYGRSSRSTVFNRDDPDLVAVPIDVITTNSLVQPHLVLRMQPSTGTVRPYLEGKFGFKYLFTDTRIQNQRRSDEEIASSRNFDDITISGGAGAGAHFMIMESVPESSIGNMYINLGFQYSLGREAEYLASGPVRDESGTGRIDREDLDIRRSTTHLLIPMVGLAIQF